jgi:serine/threonine-protein kinase
MEFVDGPTLRQLLRHPDVEKLPLPAVLTLGVQLCSALEYAHGKRDLLGTPLRIVHRDVSPDNVIADRQGYAKLCDFGISKSTLEQLDDEAESGTWKGKKGYMSPEQCEHRHIDRRSDVFSLGIVLWEMLAGTRLFAGDNLYAVMSSIREAPIPPAASVSDCPPALSEIVMHALRRDPDERYASAADLERALIRFVHENNLELGTMPLGAILRRHFPATQHAHDELAMAVLSAGPLTEVTVVEAS